MFGLLNSPHYTNNIARPFGHGLDISEHLLKKAHVLGDLIKLVVAIVNYIYRPLEEKLKFTIGIVFLVTSNIL
jgi:hypothetical protein